MQKYFREKRDSCDVKEQFTGYYSRILPPTHHRPGQSPVGASFIALLRQTMFCLFFPDWFKLFLFFFLLPCKTLLTPSCNLLGGT